MPWKRQSPLELQICTGSRMLEVPRYRSGRRSLNLRLEVRVWPTYNAPKFQASTASGPMTRPMHSEQRLRACSALGVLDPCVAAFSLPAGVWKKWRGWILLEMPSELGGFASCESWDFSVSNWVSTGLASRHALGLANTTTRPGAGQDEPDEGKTNRSAFKTSCHVASACSSRGLSRLLASWRELSGLDAQCTRS
jgi:hypothetical protein